MIQRCLSPGMVKCIYVDNCNKYSYDRCMSCKNNDVAREKKEREKKKKNYYRSLR
jgi:hypothetical protein